MTDGQMYDFLVTTNYDDVTIFGIYMESVSMYASSDMLKRLTLE